MKKQLTDEEKMVRTINNFKKRFNRIYNVPVGVIPGLGKEHKFVTLDKIKAVVDEVVQNDISIRNRKKVVVYGRHCYSKIAKDLGFAYTDIGNKIKRDHSSVINGFHKANDFADCNDPLYINIYNQILNKLK
jgi:chromosomal replication initiation ATPase DnaA